mmetsp:Transcript_80313/g.141643  ORF Transcript_80313/g.141643 Transcript_80313/m.141643 type:complete len:111 (-) Transcript_80313:896-1228(-)
MPVSNEHTAVSPLGTAHQTQTRRPMQQVQTVAGSGCAEKTKPIRRQRPHPARFAPQFSTHEQSIQLLHFTLFTINQCKLAGQFFFRAASYLEQFSADLGVPYFVILWQNT